MTILIGRFGLSNYIKYNLYLLAQMNEIEKKILITGATGFIGSNLVKRLNKKKIITVSRNKIDNKSHIICDFETEIIQAEVLNNVDTVFHLAGIAHDLKERTNLQKKYELVNIEATKKIAEMSAKAGVKKFIFLSSIRASKNQFFEKGNNYGFSKRCAEKYLLEIAKKTSMNIIIIRSPLVYGPQSKGNLKVMYHAIKKGWFPPLPKDKGNHIMIHIDDLISCLLLFLNKKLSSFKVYYLSDGLIYSIRDIYNHLCKIAKKKIPSWHVPWFVFVFLSLINKKIRRKIKIIFGSYYYPSTRINRLGFIPTKSLEDLNEKDF